MSTKATLATVTALSICWAEPALAQDGPKAPEKKYIPETKLKEEKKDDEDEKKDGIDWRINAGATINFSDNRNVVGQVDGTSFTFGFKFDAGVDWRKDAHELRNTLNIQGGISRTPALERFVKAQDQLDYESLYLYHILKWVGIYGRVGYNTTMFRGVDVRAEPTNYEITFLDGSTARRDGRLTLTLTDPFRPSRFRQSLGVFAQPYAKKPLTIEARVGAGGRETLANGQFALNDNEDTADVIEVSELDDVLQFGAEATVELFGQFDEGRVTYRASADVMMPLLNNNDDDTKNVLDLTNVVIKGQLGVKIVEWASIDYQLLIVREPQLIDKFQIGNQLLFNFGIATAGTTSKKEEEGESAPAEATE